MYSGCVLYIILCTILSRPGDTNESQIESLSYANSVSYTNSVSYDSSVSYVNAVSYANSVNVTILSVMPVLLVLSVPWDLSVQLHCKILHTIGTTYSKTAHTFYLHSAILFHFIHANWKSSHFCYFFMFLPILFVFFVCFLLKNLTLKLWPRQKIQIWNVFYYRYFTMNKKFLGKARFPYSINWG